MTITVPHHLYETDDWTVDVRFDDDGNASVNLSIDGTMNGDSAQGLARTLLEVLTGEGK